MDLETGRVRRPETWDWAALHQHARRITQRCLRHREDAEDAAQEAILRAYRAVNSGAKPTNVEAWLTTIAKREAYRLRARTASSTSLLDEEAPGAPIDETTLTDLTIDRLTVHQLLDELTPDSRALLLRRFALDQSSAVIAHEIDVPASTVRVRLHRALAQMRKLDAERSSSAARPKTTERRGS